jgi:hypothetical protein
MIRRHSEKATAMPNLRRKSEHIRALQVTPMRPQISELTA